MRGLRGFVLGVLLFAAANSFVDRPLAADLSSNFAQCRSAVGELVEGKQGWDPCHQAAGEPVARGALFVALAGLVVTVTSRRNRITAGPVQVAPVLHLVTDGQRRRVS